MGGVREDLLKLLKVHIFEPQLLQNLLPVATSALHLGHFDMSAVPQLGQNLDPDSKVCLHGGQMIFEFDALAVPIFCVFVP
jgi:hypothetical protein